MRRVTRTGKQRRSIASCRHLETPAFRTEGCLPLSRQTLTHSAPLEWWHDHKNLAVLAITQGVDVDILERLVAFIPLRIAGNQENKDEDEIASSYGPPNAEFPELEQAKIF